MLCRLGLREHLNEDVEPTLRICLYKSFQAHSINSSKSIGRIVAADDRMNRDTSVLDLASEYWTEAQTGPYVAVWYFFIPPNDARYC